MYCETAVIIGDYQYKYSDPFFFLFQYSALSTLDGCLSDSEIRVDFRVTIRIS